MTAANGYEPMALAFRVRMLEVAKDLASSGPKGIRQILAMVWPPHDLPGEGLSPRGEAAERLFLRFESYYRGARAAKASPVPTKTELEQEFGADACIILALWPAAQDVHTEVRVRSAYVPMAPEHRDSLLRVASELAPRAKSLEPYFIAQQLRHTRPPLESMERYEAYQRFLGRFEKFFREVRSGKANPRPSSAAFHAEFSTDAPLAEALWPIAAFVYEYVHPLRSGPLLPDLQEETLFEEMRLLQTMKDPPKALERQWYAFIRRHVKPIAQKRGVDVEDAVQQVSEELGRFRRSLTIKPRATASAVTTQGDVERVLREIEAYFRACIKNASRSIQKPETAAPPDLYAPSDADVYADVTENGMLARAVWMPPSTRRRCIEDGDLKRGDGLNEERYARIVRLQRKQHRTPGTWNLRQAAREFNRPQLTVKRCLEKLVRDLGVEMPYTTDKGQRVLRMDGALFEQLRQRVAQVPRRKQHKAAARVSATRRSAGK